MKFFITVLALVWAVLISSCSRSSDSESGIRSSDGSPDASIILAVVGEEKITLADFKAEAGRRERGGIASFSTTNQRQALLDDMIQTRLLLSKARAEGFDQSPDIQARIARFIAAQYQEQKLASRSVNKPSEATEAEAQEFYRQHPEQFGIPAAVRPAIIFIKASSKATDEKRAEIRQRAEAILAEARAADAAGFARLAQAHSEDQATRYTGGDAGWWEATSALPWSGAVVDAAFAIANTDDCAPLVETPDGFYILRLKARRAADVRPFEAVQEAIQYQLGRQKEQRLQHDFLEDLKRGIRVEQYPDALDQIPIPGRVAESQPPPLPKS